MGSRTGAKQLVLGLLFACAILFSSALAQSCVKRDRDALLNFKAGISDPLKQLKSWSSKNNCCKDFVGVTCNTKGEVVNVTFAGLVDEECDENCPFIGSSKKNRGKDLIGPNLSKLAALQTLSLKHVWLYSPFPSGLSALKHLSYLSLTNVGLEGSLPTDLFKVTSLRYLAFDGVKGGLTDGFCKLKNLEILDLTENTFSDSRIGGTIPSCIGDLQNLRQLMVEWNNITGAIPPSIAKLQKLQQLKLTGNSLTGPIPGFLGELKALESLYLQGNKFSGSIPSSLGSLPKLKDLRIGGTELYEILGSGDNVSYVYTELKFTNIDGSIPATLGNLRNLDTLVIQGTKITGPIPATLGNVRTLTILGLSFNRLTGPLPSSLSRTNLTIFQVNDNHISGGIPASYGNFRYLEKFEAQRNRLTAPLPKELSKLKFSGWAYLDLSDNMITGSIPEDLPLALPSGHLNLSYNNLSGSLKPSSWYNVRLTLLNNNQLTSLGAGSIPQNGQNGMNVVHFDVHSNLISGPIPEWPFQFYQAWTIDLSDNKFTAFPKISSRLQASYINVSNNQIVGSIPEVFGNVSGLNVLDMSRNKLYGSIPRGFGSQDFISRNNLNILDLSFNALTGTIPEGIFDGVFFNTLNVRNNKLTGSLPERNGSNAFLREVDVTNNKLTGSIPVSIFNGSTVALFKAGNNRLTGGVPNLDCSKFPATLVLENNLLTGPVLPHAITEDVCYNLEVFDVSGNKLTGEIPEDLKTFENLKVLDLSFNSLTGGVKKFLARLLNLRILDLSSNKLSGAVPWKNFAIGFKTLRQAGVSAIKFSPKSPLYESSLCYYDLSPGSFIRVETTTFSSTTALNVSHNALSGTVSPSVGQLKGLHALDLSYNKFSGMVPETIADITDLDHLDVSYNNFSGPIATRLSKFPARAFVGNNLCGKPLSKRCH
ncbi:hypothetical protein R1flu_022589 [Riccia fluitans]|uniref:Leucine-rich repeat-containing N-terminal plant-type domain-containing protein n=1 Tax=Riccia fluitans TaxID=41844 RepID=A0ABD1XPL7_9MARC